MAVNKLEDGKDSRILCQNCTGIKGQTYLVVRTNRQNGQQFLGCPNWPECDYTRPIPDCIKMRLSGAPELFDAGGEHETPNPV